jgi:hypothetical protein
MPSWRAMQKRKPAARRDAVAVAELWSHTDDDDGCRSRVDGHGLSCAIVAVGEISHEIGGPSSPTFLRNIQLLGWDHPYFLVTNQTHIYPFNFYFEGGTLKHGPMLA